VARIVSVQRITEGVVVCLLLQPNETSQELLTFARPRKRSVTQPPPASLTTLQTDLSAGLASPPASSLDEPPVGTLELLPSGDRPGEQGFQAQLARERAAFRARQRKERLPDDPVDTFIASIRRNLPKSPRGRTFSAAVGALSRGFASMLRLPAPTVSATMAGMRGVSTQEIHFGLGIPQLSTPILGQAIRDALRADLVTALGNRDLRTLQAARDIIEATPQIAPVGRTFAANLDRIARDFISRLEPD